VDQGTVQRELPAGPEEVRLRHQPDLDQCQARPGGDVLGRLLLGGAGDHHAQGLAVRECDIADTIKTSAQPQVFDDTNIAKNALQNGQIDGIVVDLPTAFYITAVQIPKSTIVGQFQPEAGQQEQFGLLFEKGNTLVSCADQALATLKSDGVLASLEKRWLSDAVDAPRLDS
jgi:Bacterial extracellular solute-binding proteins, family 3